MLIKRRKHTVPSLNTTSTADISFMLLTFFLVTSSMDIDRGLVRQLPPADNDEEDQSDAMEVSRENTLSFKIGADNTITMNDKTVEVKGLREKIARFITPRASDHIIYIDTNPKSGYNTYFQLEDEIVAAYNKVRNDLAQKMYHHAYAACTEEEKKSVREKCPQHIAETYETDDAQANASKEGGEI